MDKSLLVDIIGQVSSENLKMYFVTRILKEGLKVNTRVLEKFDFKVYQIEITEEVRSYIYQLSLKQFKKIQDNDDLNFLDYDVIADETEHLFTYQNGAKVFDKEEGLLKMSTKYWEMYKHLKNEIGNDN